MRDEELLTLRILTTSDPLRTKDAAMKSMSLMRPHLVKSSSSLLVSVGRSTTTPGKLTFLRSLHAIQLSAAKTQRLLQQLIHAGQLQWR